MLDRRALAWAVLCLCLTSLSVSLLQVRRAAYPPSVRMSRAWKVPSDSMVNLSGVQDVYVSIFDTVFENAFINYTNIVILGADNPFVKTSWFARSVPPDIPYIVFHTEIEAKDEEVQVYYEFVMPHSTNTTVNSTVVIYLHTNTNATYIEMDGLDANGTRISRTTDFKKAYQRYFLYIIPLRDYSFYEVDKIRIAYSCPPNSNISGWTVIRIFNIFDNVPAVDGVPLEQGDSGGVSLRGVKFPHFFEWRGLKPQNVSLSTTCWLNVSWSSTIHLINYTWLAPIREIDGLIDAYLDLFFYRPADAPISQARISLTENGHHQTIDIMSNVTEAFSNQPKEEWPRVLIPLPKEFQEVRVDVALLYWPSPWSEIALFSLVIMIIELLIFSYMKVKSKSLQPRNNISKSKDPY